MQSNQPTNKARKTARETNWCNQTNQQTKPEKQLGKNKRKQSNQRTNKARKTARENRLSGPVVSLDRKKSNNIHFVSSSFANRSTVECDTRLLKKVICLSGFCRGFGRAMFVCGLLSQRFIERAVYSYTILSLMRACVPRDVCVRFVRQHWWV